MSVFNGLESYKINDLAWCGGFFDADGCVTILRQPYKKRSGEKMISHRLRVNIVQNSYDVLEHFLNVCGCHGKIFKFKRTIETNRQCYQLNFDGAHAYEVLMKMYPFLIRKKAEAEAVSRFWSEGGMEERRRTGRKPVAPEIFDLREKWCKKLQRMK